MHLRKAADIVIVAAGARSVFKQALQSIDRGGSMLIFSAAEENLEIPVNINDIFWRSEINITSSYGASPLDCAEALNWIHDKKIDVGPLITHRIGLQEIRDGFRLVAEGKESIKVVVLPDTA